MNIIKVNRHSELPVDYTGIAEYPTGKKEWWFNRKLHRTDGPAIEYSNGAKEWFLKGYWYRLEKDYWIVVRLTKRIKKGCCENY